MEVIAQSTLQWTTQAIVGTAVVGGLLGYELPSKVAGLNAGQVSVRNYVKGCGRVICRCLPEVLGLTTVLILAVLLRLRGDDGFIPSSAEELAHWEKIKAEWWLLMGADTLLNLQAMLRLLLLLFVGIRADTSGRSPLSGMASVFYCGGMLARGALATSTRMYVLEGPLSLNGDLSIACELAMVPVLAGLSIKSLRRFPVAVVAVGFATWYSKQNYFDMARNPDVDSLFTLAHILELFGAFAYLLRTISVYCAAKEGERSSGIVGFMHLLMPAQAALASYYWLTAFTPEEQLPIGKGRPWCLLIMTNLLQLAAFLCSVALYFGESFVGTAQEEATVPELEEEAFDREENRAFQGFEGLGAPVAGNGGLPASVANIM